MARVKIENEQLVVSMKGARKYFAAPSLFKLTSEMSLPLQNVTGVTGGVEWRELPGLLDKEIGTDLHGFYYGGSFKQDGDKVFYDLKKSEEAVVISLNDEKYKRLFIGVEDADATVALIQQALDNR